MRKKGDDATIDVSCNHADSSSSDEMLYLMSSPRNAERLDRSIKEIELGHRVIHPLIED